MPRERITSATCQTCGLCCIATTDQVAFCDVTVEDLKRLNRTWVRRNVRFPSMFDRFAHALDGQAIQTHGAIKTKWQRTHRGRFRGYSMCRCVALRGDPGHQVKCSIYDRRPDTCRKAVKPGDRTCRAIRADYDRALQEDQLGADA